VRAAAASVRERPTLTGRAVILAVVLGMLVLTLVVPLRELVAQRAAINALTASNEAAQARVDQLELQKRRLEDPAYIQSLIRSRLHYVMPGEVGYVVLDPDEAPAPEKAAAATAPGAWYDKLWQAVEDADTAGSGTRAAPAAASR
jgi:cell division protein FtsB